MRLLATAKKANATLGENLGNAYITPVHLGQKRCRSQSWFPFRTISARMKPFGAMLTVVQQDWTDNRLEFRIRALGQTSNGIVDVEEDHVRLEIHLPLGLRAFAEKAKALVQRSGKLLLEKK